MSGLWVLDEDWLEDSKPWDIGNADDETVSDDEPLGWEEDDDLEEVINPL